MILQFQDGNRKMVFNGFQKIWHTKKCIVNKPLSVVSNVQTIEDLMRFCDAIDHVFI